MAFRDQDLYRSQLENFRVKGIESNKEPDSICNNCHWFAPQPCADRYSMEQLGLYGYCRCKSPGDRGWPTTWGSFDCGEWKKRDKPPVTDPSPDWMREIKS
jgi:hypothetical protein